MLPQFNSIVLDVVVVVFALTIIAIGAFKGIKHTSINFVLLLGSIALAFAPFMDVVRAPIIELFSNFIKLGAGISDEMRLGVYLLYPFIASFILMVLIFVILRLFKLLIFMLIKRKQLNRNQLLPIPKKASRITGALFSLVFNGALFIVFLSVFATPLVGGNKSIEGSYVTKYIAMPDDLLIDTLVGEENLVEEKVMIRFVKGNLYIKVNDEDAKAFADISKLVNEDELVPTNLSNVQETLDNMKSLLLFTKDHALDDKGLEKDGFEKYVETVRDTVGKCIDKMNTMHGSNPAIDAEGTLAIRKLLTDVGLEKKTQIFENIFVIR